MAAQNARNLAAGARQKTPLQTNIIKGPKHTDITEDTTNDEDEGGNKMTGDMNIDPAIEGNQEAMAFVGTGMEEPVRCNNEDNMVTDDPVG